MDSFIDFLCTKIHSEIQAGKEPLFVLPNKRPIVFIQQKLAQNIQNPIWFPKILTIDDFVQEISGLKQTPTHITAKRLYEIYKATLQEHADSFDDFIKWWSMLIADFNDVDMYMVSTSDLFSYINDIKALELWNLGQQDLTQLQQEYLKFWKLLPELYSKLRESLHEDHVGYRGMIYRKAAQTVYESSFKSPWHQVIFAGFNALSVSEEQIIEYFLSNEQGKIYWEADSYYLDDKKQEAGRFIRHYQDKWSKFTRNEFFITDNFKNTKKNISIIGAPKSMMQAAQASEIASSYMMQQSDATALIPAQEELLLPLLYQLPEGNINISMGYPLNFLPLHSLYRIVVNLLNDVNSHQKQYLNRHLYLFLNHPYCKGLFDTETMPDSKQLSNELLSSGQITYSLNDFCNLLNTHHCSSIAWIFKECSATEGKTFAILSFWKKINQKLRNFSKQIQDEIMGAQVQSYDLIIENIKNTFYSTEDSIIQNAETLLYLIEQQLQTENIPFIGDSTKNIQLTGLLETRMLAFKNIIITDVNEGILPGSKNTARSFIPYEIRRTFKLPTYNESEAVYAYHFYRLLQYAENVYLLYNTETDAFGSGEKSRFITQLEVELPQINKQINLVSRIVKLSQINIQNPPIIQVKQSPESIQKLAKLSFSATALISLKNCSLQYYFKYIEQIKEFLESDPEIQANIVGSIIHEVLKNIYEPLQNKILTETDLSFTYSQLAELTKNTFNKLNPHHISDTGKGYLFINTAVRIIDRFLKKEIQEVKNKSTIKILNTEQEFEAELQTQFGDIKFKGTIDRVDLYNQRIRIADYKTGKVESTNLSLKQVEDAFLDTKKDYAFQLLFYIFLFQKNQPHKPSVTAGIYHLKKISTGLIPLSYNSEFNVLMEGFEHNLLQLLNDLFSKNKVYKQTENRDVCAKCPYAPICMR